MVQNAQEYVHQQQALVDLVHSQVWKREKEMRKKREKEKRKKGEKRKKKAQEHHPAVVPDALDPNHTTNSTSRPADTRNNKRSRLGRGPNEVSAHAKTVVPKQ